MPCLFHRQIGGLRRVTSTGTILNNLRRRCQILGETNPAFRGLHLSPHDIRRLFATDPVNNGYPSTQRSPVRHVNLQTTQGYVAVFEEDVIRHTQDDERLRRPRAPRRTRRLHTARGPPNHRHTGARSRRPRDPCDRLTDSATPPAREILQ